MYISKKGSALISTMMILALISTIGCFMFKMMMDNNEMSSLYEFDKDIYDLSKNEEEDLYKYMKEINEDYNANKSSEEDINPNIMFEKSFNRNLNGSNLDYDIEKDKLTLITSRYGDKKREREIQYTFKKDKVILIPTFNFQNIDDE